MGPDDIRLAMPIMKRGPAAYIEEWSEEIKGQDQSKSRFTEVACADLVVQATQKWTKDLASDRSKNDDEGCIRKN